MSNCSAVFCQVQSSDIKITNHMLKLPFRVIFLSTSGLFSAQLGFFILVDHSVGVLFNDLLTSEESEGRKSGD